MLFVINGMKYNTDNMEKVAEVKKWYQIDNVWTRSVYPGEEVGKVYICELWKSKKGNWLLTHEMNYSKVMGEAITEEEARELLMGFAAPAYENLFGELPEA